MPEPTGILAEIVERKRIDVAARLQGVTLDALRSRAAPSRQSLADALSRPGARFVMEVKRSSPSSGVIRSDFRPAALARAYRGAADAISVLTDTPYFGGSLDDLAEVRAEYSGPILAKDFVVDPRQVPEARLFGADAVLAMLSVLDDSEVRVVIDEASRLSMDVLVEAHDEDEVRRAVALGAKIVGINNRDLRTLTVDLATTERLAPMVPHDRFLVAESGIEGRADVERLSPLVDAFLVGSSLMRSDDPALAARALAAARVKVCGITNVSDLMAAAASGAAYAGLVMVPHTPRAVTPRETEPIAEAAARKGIPLVGVFRNEKVLQIAVTAQALNLAAVQLHGEEDALYVRALRGLLPPGCEIWTAGVVGAQVPEPRLGTDRTLFDTGFKGRSGGTGRTFDWSRLAGRRELGRSLLAGGLGPANAAAAARVGAFALDVSSGVERAPGRKDAGKLHAFFEALRLPARGEMQQCA